MESRKPLVITSRLAFYVSLCSVIVVTVVGQLVGGVGTVFPKTFPVEVLRWCGLAVIAVVAILSCV
ncbi:hypothetical protein AB1L42_08710 [Thalassoglobus sp. JC818]|uniref:hypothetical protein n=1 Tax=Thalassoglobus sp. JC818 TaxID=3232136 RepID=UPI003457BCCC